MTIEPSSFFLLRRPALPINGHALDDKGLQMHWSDALVQEAVYTASPTLYEQLHQAVKKNSWPLPSPLRQSLHKYVMRMSTRSTPFGLFAGCLVGEVGEATRIAFSPARPFVKHRRLDAACLAGIVRQLNACPIVQAQVRFYPNDSIYAVGNELRYIEYHKMGQERHFFTSSVRWSEHLESVLELARTGATAGALTDSLVSEAISAEQATAFISELIAQQLLVSDLGTALTEPAPLTALLNRLSRIKGNLPVREALERTAQVLSALHSDGRSVQREIARTLEPYFDNSGRLPLIQTDLFLNADANCISDACIRTLSSQVAQLLPLNRHRANPLITEFADRFRSRYDQQEIPLLLALDNESGIGYGSARGGDTDYVPLLDGLTFPAPPDFRTVTWGAYENLLLTKLNFAHRNRCVSVDLTDGELQSIAPPVPVPLPANFYLLGNLLASSPAAIDQGNFSFNLLVAQGPSLANLMGRFCAHSPQLTEKVKARLRLEEQQQPAAVFAEIVHSPHERLGNVLTRPALYTYEIPVVSQCSVAEEFRISMDDLLVSVGADNRVRLRSRRLQKDVITRLSTAHNYQNGLPVYQFLCDLQKQSGSLSLHWDWGPLGEQAFLPRITYRNIILSRARWRIRFHELPGGTAGELIDYLEAHLLLPRWVAIAEGDNELVFNLNREPDRQLFREEVRKRGECQIMEWLATPDRCWLRDERGLYTNEVVLSGSCASEAPVTEPATGPVHREALPPRAFLPGSEWLYVKIYAGTNMSNRLLNRVIWPLMHKLSGQNKISSWFFVRYADPEPHIRLRCRLNNPKLFAPLVSRLSKLLDAYREAGAVQTVRIDTYEREFERYGGATMLPSEDIFAADSTAIMQYAALRHSPDDHWLFALRSIDALLTDFGQPLPARISLLSGLRDGLLEEYRADAVLKRQLNDKYRTRQRVIDREMTEAGPEDDPIGRVLALRSSVIRTAAAQIKARLTGNDHAPSLDALLGSYAHMSMNRLFASQQRIQELVVYHHLARHYESRRARQQASDALAEATSGLVEKTEGMS